LLNRSTVAMISFACSTSVRVRHVLKRFIRHDLKRLGNQDFSKLVGYAVTAQRLHALHSRDLVPACSQVGEAEFVTKAFLQTSTFFCEDTQKAGDFEGH
jgi:hypothetical protein